MQHTSAVLKPDFDVFSFDSWHIDSEAELLRVLSNFVARTGKEHFIFLEISQHGWDPEDGRSPEEIVIKASKWASVPEGETHCITVVRWVT
jgi:glycerophosphoryl diester phosphodiesterase